MADAMHQELHQKHVGLSKALVDNNNWSWKVKKS